MNNKLREGKSILLTVLMGLAIISAGSAKAQHIYPKQGQSPQQQQRDESECSSWATQQTGYQPAPNSGSDGGIVSDRTLRGAARGAGIGAIGGAIGGDAGAGAAIGAAVGGITGGIRNQDEQSRQNDFRNAFIACLEGRGYSVR